MKRGWCEAHGTRDDGLRDIGPVERPAARRRRDLYARVGSGWTEGELLFLRRQKDRMSVREMARRLHRSPKAVTNMLSKMRLRKRRVASNGPDRWSPPAIGLPGKRWTVAEDEALLASVGMGKERSVVILHRSLRACRERLRELGEGAMCEQDGMLSARQVAVLYGCPRSRVWRLIESGMLDAHKGVGGRWRIDPMDAERMGAELSAPKRTWVGTAPDVGDYWERYGLRRVS